jgi:exonuclease III
MSWNIRGMNNTARQEDIKRTVSLFKPDLVCLQETKMEVITSTIIRNSLRLDYELQFVYLPTAGSRGGILVDVRDHVLQIQQASSTTHTISVDILDIRINRAWKFTGVYGPQGDLEKRMFIRELKHLKPIISSAWLVMGDFNLIYQAEDKNNGRLNRRLMLRFRQALNHMEIKEIQVVGRKFT